MKVSIRKMDYTDLDMKIRWINDRENNKFLHYDLPLVKDKTLQWYEKNKNNKNRFDGIIEVNGNPIGLIGLLSIKDHQAEFYITIGETKYKGKGIARKASQLLLDNAFNNLGLSKVYLYTEVQNKKAQRLFDKLGFRIKDIEVNRITNRGQPVSRFYYELGKFEYINNQQICYSPIQLIEENSNTIYIKRDDLIPFSFGGNKARKAELFFKEIEKNGNDYVVTYGTNSSNHCRVIANLAAMKGLPCLIISPKESEKDTYNKKMMELFNASFLYVKLDEVKETINKVINKLKSNGYNPYFIQGGGHGNIGTQAYVNAYEEIRHYQIINNIKFDYMFFASGTGTTQAGLICGKLINKDNVDIIGISIARKKSYGKQVVIESVDDYMHSNDFDISDVSLEDEVIFIDDYVSTGYGISNSKIKKCIKNMMVNYGIPLDTTYTGKAYTGMINYLDLHEIKNKKILFIHTGGTPLFFDDLKKI